MCVRCGCQQRQDAVHGAPGNLYVSAVWTIVRIPTVQKREWAREGEGHMARWRRRINLFSPYPDSRKCDIYAAGSVFLSFNTETASDEPCFRYTQTISSIIFVLKSTSGNSSSDSNNFHRIYALFIRVFFWNLFVLFLHFTWHHVPKYHSKPHHCSWLVVRVCV